MHLNFEIMIRIISTNISSHLPKQWYFSNRRVSTSVSQLNQQRKHVVEEDKERWNRLYTSFDMKYLAINTKLKIYPAVGTCLGTPAGCMVDYAGILSEFHIFPGVLVIGKFSTRRSSVVSNFNSRKIVPIFSGFCSTIILSAFSAAISRTIGKIDVNQKRNLKLYYIDFFGRQIVKEITVDELRKCKKSDLKFKLYKTIDTTDDKGQPIQLKIAPNRGDIYDTVLFKRLFRTRKSS